MISLACIPIKLELQATPRDLFVGRDQVCNFMALASRLVMIWLAAAGRQAGT